MGLVHAQRLERPALAPPQRSARHARGRWKREHRVARAFTRQRRPPKDPLGVPLPVAPLEATRIRRSTSGDAVPEVGAAGGPVGDDLAREIRRPGAGQPIPPEVRSRYEAAFGVSFADVRLHTDSDVARRISASAFTLGRDIHFAPGQFRPDTKEGARTLAHELAHVVQQSGPVQRTPGTTILQREWVPGGGGRITTSSSAYKRAFHACCDAISEVPTVVGTIVRVDEGGRVVRSRRQEFARIDLQEFIGDGWLNVQCQAGGVSMAGVLCPPDLPLATFRDGLRRAIDGNCMFTWVPTTTTEETGRGGRRRGPKGGGDDKGQRPGQQKGPGPNQGGDGTTRGRGRRGRVAAR